MVQMEVVLVVDPYSSPGEGFLFCLKSKVVK